jgi:hypothetical protein
MPLRIIRLWKQLDMPTSTCQSTPRACKRPNQLPEPQASLTSNPDHPLLNFCGGIWVNAARCVSICPSPYVMGQRLLQGIVVPVGCHMHIFVLMLPSCRVLTFARSILELLGLTALHGDTMTHGKFVCNPLQPLPGHPTR